MQVLEWLLPTLITSCPDLLAICSESLDDLLSYMLPLGDVYLGLPLLLVIVWNGRPLIKVLRIYMLLDRFLHRYLIQFLHNTIDGGGVTLLNSRLEANRRQILGRSFLGGVQTLYHISLELILNLVQTPSLVDQLLELRFILAIRQ